MDDRQMEVMLQIDEHHWWFRGRREVLKAELARLPLPAPRAKILDAGCGSGRTLLDLKQYGEVSGAELNPQAAEAARARGPFDVRIARLEDLSWPDATFDLITCLDVLEHTPDDQLTLRELARVTRPGGWLLVTVPAYPLLWSEHDVTNHHYRRYSRRPLRIAATSSGWSVQRMTSFNSLLLLPAAVIRLRQRWRGGDGDGDYTPDLHLGPAWMNGALEQPLRWEARWLSSGRRLPAGLSLLAILRRSTSDVATTSSP